MYWVGGDTHLAGKIPMPCVCFHVWTVEPYACPHLPHGQGWDQDGLCTSSVWFSRTSVKENIPKHRKERWHISHHIFLFWQLFCPEKWFLHTVLSK